MNKDFRVSVTITTHCKIKKLMRRLGDRSFYNLIGLWAYVAVNKPDGILTGMNGEDLEIAADWNGECSKLVLALLELKFIDKKDGVYSIHDWENHNGYAFYSEQRSERARNAAKARWNKSNKNKELMLSDAKRMQQASPSNAPSPSPSPSPSPDPYPFLKKKIYKRKKQPVQTPVPSFFPITEQMQKYAEQKNYIADLEDLTEAFLLHHKSKGSFFVCWYSAWQKWLRNQLDWYPEKNVPKGQAPIVNLQPQTYAQAQDAERRQRSQWLLKAMKNEKTDTQSNSAGTLKAISELPESKE